MSPGPMKLGTVLGDESRPEWSAARTRPRSATGIVRATSSPIAAARSPSGAGPSAVHHPHVLGEVPLTRDGPVGDSRRDPGQVLGFEPDVERTERFAEPRSAAGAYQRDDIDALSQDPGDGELRGGRAFLGGDGGEP